MKIFNRVKLTQLRNKKKIENKYRTHWGATKKQWKQFRRRSERNQEAGEDERAIDRSTKKFSITIRFVDYASIFMY